MRILFSTAALLVLHGHAWVHAQSTSVPMGAENAAIGNANACSSTPWALFANPASTATYRSTAASMTASMPQSLPDANSAALCLVMPLNVVVTSVGFFRFGDNTYSEQSAQAGVAGKFGIAALGVGVRYLQYRAQGFETTSLFTLQLGGIASLSRRFQIGAYIHNINQPKLSERNNQRLPAAMVAGVGYRPSEKLLASAEVHKQLRQPVWWRAGISYAIYTRLSVATGVNLNPDAAFAGFGYHTNRFSLQYAAQYSFTIGAVHHVSITYRKRRQ